MKTVLHILNTGEYSGAENVVITIINEMKKQKKYRLIYVSLDGTIKKVLKEKNIEFEPIKKMNTKEIRRVIKKYNPDVIHAHDFTASIICSASINRKVKLISHIHNNSPWITKIHHPYTWIYLITTIRYNKILCVSKAIVDEYIFGNYIKKKCEIIENPIDIEKIKELAKFEKEKYNNYDIIFLGRLSKAKNPLRFINIINRVKEKNPNISVAMLGDGELRRECEKMIKEKKLGNTIEMYGFMKNPYPILAKSNLLCITSEWEGYGLVAVEALSLGIPVVATRVGGIPTIVNEKCGKLCDNNEEFINEILKLLRDEKYYKLKSENALKRAEEKDNINAYINQLKNIYA